VILSRHFHNFIAAGIVDEVLASAMEALRPGGVLAIVQHRALPDAVPEWEQRTGYVREQWLIETVTSAGFVLQAVSSIHHNPHDSREHEDGVWSLPPSFRTCSRMEATTEKQVCLDRFAAIGESDRMTLKFVKPD
jgi:predicted methyltransferase